MILYKYLSIVIVTYMWTDIISVETRMLEVIPAVSGHSKRRIGANKPVSGYSKIRMGANKTVSGQVNAKEDGADQPVDGNSKILRDAIKSISGHSKRRMNANKPVSRGRKRKSYVIKPIHISEKIKE